MCSRKLSVKFAEDDTRVCVMLLNSWDSCDSKQSEMLIWAFKGFKVAGRLQAIHQ